jgi:hypothetical protein
MLLDEIYLDGFLPFCAKWKIEQKYILKPGAAFGRKIKPYVRQQTINNHRTYFPLEEEPLVEPEPLVPDGACPLSDDPIAIVKRVRK